ncbi:MAG: transporter substrate-binding domain-containing protein [Devosia sp.]|uniref:transporter substrate-binding domain-containing protein n=1 Tax=Devosia sp. TaxID=1871048 RepID=UPI0024CC9122|nr:transporter substrate-binding domain-containing protein [Devosia sp.]UYN99301.1 MAG: transporter substrate-binding domain-containing protein [Devosia sp.]
MRTMTMRIAQAMMVTLVLLAPAAAQPLPYHADPDAREILPNLRPVPAIRFLTTADFPPFNFRDANGDLIGFNIDLAKRICTEVNVACTIQAWPWAQAADALADSQGDALIAGLSMDGEAAGRFDYSATYLSLPGRFVTRRNQVDGFTPDALEGGKVAVRDGGAHQQFLARYLPEIEQLPFAGEIEALEAVKTGEADAYFGDAMRASFWLNDNLDCCSFAGGAYFRPALFGQGMTIATSTGNDPVRHAIDWALVRLKDNGTLDELYLRWFPVGFY